MAKKKVEKADDPVAASSASSWALFKESVPKKMKIGGEAGKKSVETGVAQDDTLMGRLAKRMVARDYIAKQNLGMGKEAPKANTADMQADLDDLAKKDQTEATHVLINKDKQRKKSSVDKFPAFGEEMAGKAPVATVADDSIPRRMNISNEVLMKGIDVEKEHTKNPKEAKKIAMDHLKESPNYYKDWDKKEKNLFKETAEQGTVVLGTPDVEPSKPVKGNNMAQQARNSGNVFGRP